MKSSNYLKKLYGNPTDEKYTPGYGVLPIIKYIPEGKIVWCPFDTKRSEFVQKFKDAGFHVVYSVSIRPRACFSPSYNKVKSQTKHVWLLTLL